MGSVQTSQSQGLYAVRQIGIEKLILHLRYAARPLWNHALHKLGASTALAYASVALAQLHTIHFNVKCSRNFAVARL